MKYQTIVADPPWNVKAGRAMNGYVVKDGKQPWNPGASASRELAFPTMTVAEIAALPVGSLAAADAHLYLWTINKYLPDAFAIVRAWGFTYSTMIVWAKNPYGNGLGGTYGISTEFCLFCRRGTLATKKDVGTTWFNWKRSYDERGKPKHSAKPPESIRMIEEVSPGPYLELFARENRAGWDAWGHECESIKADGL